MGGQLVRSFLHCLGLLGVHYHPRRDFADLDEEENRHEGPNISEKVPISLQNLCWYYQQPERKDQEPWTLRASHRRSKDTTTFIREKLLTFIQIVSGNLLQMSGRIHLIYQSVKKQRGHNAKHPRGGKKKLRPNAQNKGILNLYWIS